MELREPGLDFFFRYFHYSFHTGEMKAPKYN
jgi:hypothetical protein